MAAFEKDMRISFLLDFYGDMLTDKQKDAVDLYYNEDLSLAEIAEHTHITRQGVRDSIKRAESQLLEYEDRLGLAAKFRQVHESLDEIVVLAQKIDEMNTRYGGVSDIHKLATELGDIAKKLRENEEA